MLGGQDSLHDSDMMISDWSGAALDYAFGLNKPVCFVDVPKKVNNPDYDALDIEPFESMIRNKIGGLLDLENIHFDLMEYPNHKNSCDKAVFNIGHSGSIGAHYICEVIHAN